eukprot:GHVS01104226.1.p1 GENE.GHVS01104226.1~~GHVS01104226.1.p1  ORF type:complete len:325 (-),score=92.43 GHVS01104226.1:223-1125(-)
MWSPSSLLWFQQTHTTIYMIFLFVIQSTNVLTFQQQQHSIIGLTNRIYQSSNSSRHSCRSSTVSTTDNKFVYNPTSAIDACAFVPPLPNSQTPIPSYSPSCFSSIICSTYIPSTEQQPYKQQPYKQQPYKQQPYKQQPYKQQTPKLLYAVPPTTPTTDHQQHTYTDEQHKLTNSSTVSAPSDLLAQTKTPKTLPKPLYNSIKQLISTHDIVLFMKGTPASPMCGFSATACNILRSLKVSFVGVDVLAQQELREGIKQYSDWPTIPQLYIQGEFYGGGDIALDGYNSGDLKEYLVGRGLIK